MLAAWGRNWDLHSLLAERGAPPDPRAEPFLKVREFSATAATPAFAAARSALDAALGVAGEPIDPLAGVVGYTLTVDEQTESERLRRGESKMWAGDNALQEHVDIVVAVQQNVHAVAWKHEAGDAKDVVNAYRNGPHIIRQYGG